MTSRENPCLVAIDVGGTSIKFALWDGQALGPTQALPTPPTLTQFYAVLRQGAQAVSRGSAPVGVAFSCPGAVNQRTGVIEGASALPYIHNFDIRNALHRELGLPVALENDANCAALAELVDGAGIGCASLVFLVIGTGVGGAVVIDHQIWHGAHLFGGEFGYMLMRGDETLSDIASPVNLAKRYRHQTGRLVSGKDVFTLAQANEPQAVAAVADLVAVLGQAVFNLQYAFDPERIVIGGAVSANQTFIAQVQAAALTAKRRVKIGTIAPEVVACAYHGEANLRGAVVNYLHQA